MFRITARTVLELGSELISSEIIAFYKQIKNGFDANTSFGFNVEFDIVLPRRAYLRLQKVIDAGGRLEELKASVKDEFLPRGGGCPEAACGRARHHGRELMAKAFNLLLTADRADDRGQDDPTHGIVLDDAPVRHCGAAHWRFAQPDGDTGGSR